MYPPHTDSLRKLVSFVYYIPPEDWETEYKGGTRFYFPKSAEIARKYSNWENRPLTRKEKLEIVEEMTFVDYDYAPNRLVGFVKNDISYHSVPKIQSGSKVERFAVVMNLLTSRDHTIGARGYRKKV